MNPCLSCGHRYVSARICTSVTRAHLGWMLMHSTEKVITSPPHVFNSLGKRPSRSPESIKGVNFTVRETLPGLQVWSITVNIDQKPSMYSLKMCRCEIAVRITDGRYYYWRQRSASSRGLISLYFQLSHLSNLGDNCAIQVLQ